MCRLLCVLAAASLLALSTVAMAATIHVPADQPTIQAGLDAASYGDTVLVACGTYYEHDIIMKSGVCLISETGEADCVTVDAEYYAYDDGEEPNYSYWCGSFDYDANGGYGVTEWR